MTPAGPAARELSKPELTESLLAALEGWSLAGRRVLCIIPDATRSCPLPLIVPPLCERFRSRVKSLNFLVALGTHPPMDDEALGRLVGMPLSEFRRRYPGVGVLNHAWRTESELASVGTLTEDEVAGLSRGRFRMAVPVICNRRVLEHDVAILIGPVFPHEVVGFSGGNKYLFPGVAGQGIIDFFHWLGALITNPEIIGVKSTPVRAVVDRAAALLPVERKAVCLVVRPHGIGGGGGEEGSGVVGLFHGAPESAWSEAADLSAKVHVRYTGRTYSTVLSRAPLMYDDLWTGGKCMYKVEPVVSDGGRVIILAPHITEVSRTHGAVLEEIGYHTRDYFLEQWERFRGYPWGVLAHSTHVKGTGTFENGIERPRIRVDLATGIPETVCRRIDLGYCDPRRLRVEDFEGRESEGVLYIPQAGEILYRVAPLGA